MVRSEHFNMELMIEKAMVAMICLNLMVGACVWMCKLIMKPTYGRLSQNMRMLYTYNIYIYIYIYIYVHCNIKYGMQFFSESSTLHAALSWSLTDRRKRIHL